MTVPNPVLERLAGERESWRQELDRLVGLPSVSAAGEGLEEAGRLVADMGRKAGLQAEICSLPGAAPVVLLTGGSGSRHLLLYNHYDVQPPDPLSLWASPPFSLVERDGCLFGRGIADNKGDLAARLAAVSAWQAAGGLPCRVTFLVEGEEEIGSINLARYSEQLTSRLEADLCLWESGNRDPGGGIQISFGVKGCLYVELSVSTGRHDLHSSWATVVTGAPWRLTCALSSLVDERGEPAIDGYMELVAPPDPVQLGAAEGLFGDERALANRLEVDRVRTGIRSPGERHLFWPTVNIAGLSSGYQGPGSKTVLPARASAKLDLRLVPDLTWPRALELLREHLDRRGFEDIGIEVLGAADPHRSSLEDPWVGLVAGVARGVYGSEPVLIPTLAGTGPMREVLAGGTFCCSAGVSYEGSLIHAPNEHVRVQDLELGAEFVVSLLGRLGDC